MKLWACLLLSAVSAAHAALVADIPRLDAAPVAAWSGAVLSPALAPTLVPLGTAALAAPAFAAAPSISAAPAVALAPVPAAAALAAGIVPDAVPASADVPAAAAALAQGPAAAPQSGPDRADAAASARAAGRLFDGTGAEAPSGWGPSWRRGAFAGADGAKLSYLYRPGTGRAVLFVHGRTLGAESFLGLQDAFPGRPLVMLERRGYGRSEVGNVDEDTLGAIETDDVRRAVALAKNLGDGGKVGVLGYSLGALLQPRHDPADVAWLALVNPGTTDMVKHFTPSNQAVALMFRAGYDAAKWLFAWQRDLFIRSAIASQDMAGRLATLARGGGEALGRTLTADLERRLADSRWRELWVQETLWTGFGPKARVVQKVPILVYLNKGDETVPKSAYRELVRNLHRTAASLRVVRSPGGHLAPVFSPAPLRRALEDFDSAQSASAVAPAAPR